MQGPKQLCRILFVCHGNICRSPMAEFVMRQLVKQEGRQAFFEIASAGTSAEELGNPVYPPAQRVLRAHGIDPTGKRARRLEKQDYALYDYLVGMDTANLQNMKRLFGEIDEKKVFRLLSLAPKPRDIADPWYTGDFNQTWDDIYEGCILLLRNIAGE